jgi:hypothetical protein
MLLAYHHWEAATLSLIEVSDEVPLGLPKMEDLFSLKLL